MICNKMRWSKVRSLVENSFAASMQGRVTVHQTRYATCKCTGRAWLCFDGRQVATFSANEALNADGRGYRYSNWSNGEFIQPLVLVRAHDHAVEKGEFTNYDFTWACWDYLQEPISASVSSANPLQQTLAILSSRVGKRRLRVLLGQQLHPLPAAALRFRAEAERIQRPTRPAPGPTTKS